MGDHRSASGDSLEHWEQSDDNIQEATVKIDSVVGRAFTIFWPVGRATWLSCRTASTNIRTRRRQ
jgi:signal peptidase I